jgi:hypothetical protein
MDEEAWLNELADEAEAEGTEEYVSLEEMAALLALSGTDPGVRHARRPALP